MIISTCCKNRETRKPFFKRYKNIKKQQKDSQKVKKKRKRKIKRVFFDNFDKLRSFFDDLKLFNLIADFFQKIDNRSFFNMSFCFQISFYQFRYGIFR